MTASAEAVIHIMDYLEAEAMTAVTAIEAMTAIDVITREAMLTGTEDMTTGQKTDDQQIPVIQTMSVVVQAILEYVNLTLY